MRRTKMTSRFDGAVHDEAIADLGPNREGEEVVRIDLTYTRGTAPSQTTMILTLNAATALRDGLARLLDDAGDEDDSRVDQKDACPRCGERNKDSLVWQDDATIRCTNCGTGFEPDAQQRTTQPE